MQVKRKAPIAKIVEDEEIGSDSDEYRYIVKMICLLKNKMDINMST